ncbi:hypothetical protein MalM25_27770 [Planctomycetes bacterium MalM25]|nr:hypothetical protein MalM25_27770 [Planctomycetes bacterium MalM25]
MIRNANDRQGPDEIVFDPAVFPIDEVMDTITLTEGELVISDSVTITGLGAEELTINAGDGTDGVFGTGDGHRVFQIVGNSDVTLSGLTLTGGDVSLAA